ncbi:MAG: Twin-arginine translocation protein TatB [uncultured Sphingomonadaceae bacterium]|uniref:Twin-arginine translocation protein TatB n=1 Tax=uncultured Sphingomonadaceae bacterium TaxID=169976 RepID=A0A6J4T2X6_9SPHN|nr:MAG: Twin-arginine translocation protein TatB [uncultured Sphingomonadaceae bacterium]
MFGVDSVEFLVVAVVALLVIGPKDLPHVLRKVGQWVGRARGVARHFRSGLDTMIRESELDEMEKRWREENDRIMREHPMAQSYVAPMTDPSLMPPPTPTVDGAGAPDGDAGLPPNTSQGEKA